MNEVLKKLEQIYQELYYVPQSTHTVHIGRLLWQVRETLEALEAKQKIWEAKAASQEDQPEQEVLTPHNDQKSPEREQSQRTRRVSSKQYIISYPDGECRNEVTNEVRSWASAAAVLVHDLECGRSIVHHERLKIQVVDL